MVRLKHFSWVFLHGLGDGPDAARELGDMLRHCGDSLVAPELCLAWQNGPSDQSSATRRLADGLLAGPARDILCKPCIVIGHSAGALVAIALAQQTGSIMGLVLLEGSFRDSDATVVRRYLSDDDSGRQRLMYELTAQCGIDAGANRYMRNVAHTDPILFRSLAIELVQDQHCARQQLVSLRQPVLFVAGENSPGASETGWHVGSTSMFSTVTVPGAAHWVQIDAASQVFGHVRAWAVANFQD